MRLNIDLMILTATAQIPEYAHDGDSGFDLVANNDGDIVLTKGNRFCVPTGLAVVVPVGYELQVRSRSGLALKNGIAVLNSPGTVDAGYRGEIGVILINHGDDDFVIKNGM